MRIKLVAYDGLLESKIIHVRGDMGEYYHVDVSSFKDNFFQESMEEKTMSQFMPVNFKRLSFRFDHIVENINPSVYVHIYRLEEKT